MWLGSTRTSKGLPAPKGDDVYTLFGKTGLHPFIQWVGDVFSIKTPELKRQTIVAAMYGAFEKNEAEARKFWSEVSRGGVEFDDNHPTTVLEHEGSCVDRITNKRAPTEADARLMQRRRPC